MDLGAIGTIHAGSAMGALRRLEQLIQEAVVTVPRRHVFSVLDLGNLKFRFPRLHRRWYVWRHGEAGYEHRYGDNPFRLQHYYQFQVLIKPSPADLIDKYLGSLAALGLDPLVNDVRFVEDNWESPTLGAWGIGWQVLYDGLEITQFTYFQQCHVICGCLAVSKRAIICDLFFLF